MRTRATPLPVEERRRVILAAAVPLLLAHGRATTTRQVAEAAGIAEGTLFRVFPSKDDLFQEALDSVFDPAGFVTDLEGVDLGLPLRERMVVMTALMQRRLIDIFGLMSAMGLARPSDRGHGADGFRALSERLMVRLLAPDSGSFRVPTQDVVRTLRLVTFAGSHPHISDGRLMTPPEIVDVVLHGILGADR